MPALTSALFQEISLRGLRLANRIVVSPMCQYNSQDGCANDWHLMHLGQFSMGAGGLVMTEANHVSPEGRISPRCLGLYSDENEAAILALKDVFVFPNPFRSVAQINYSLDGTADEVKILIFTLSGRLIQELDGPTGDDVQEVAWDGRDRDGDQVANGVYVYRVLARDMDQELTHTGKIVRSRR